MLELFSFVTIFYLILISVIGYGVFFQNIILGRIKKIDNQKTIYLGFYGLLFLTFLSLVTSFFFKHGYTHNILTHLVGIFCFFYFKTNKKRNYLKYILIISLLTFVALLISKTHDDFSYYHLPFTKYLTEQKIIFGLGHIGHGYNLLSSLFYLNSIFYLPLIDYYSFHFSHLLFLIFFNFFLIKEITYYKNNEITKCLYLFALVFFNLSFNRFAEYGTDKVGQILIVILIINFFQIVCFDKDGEKINNTLLIIPLFALCISLKTYFLPYILMGVLIILFNEKYLNNFRIILLSKSFFIFCLLLMIYFFHHFISTGCIISPISITCFEDYFDWARDKNSIEKLSKWLEQWAKAGAGPNFRVEDQLVYIKNLNWFSNWFEKYFLGKFLEQLLLLLSSILVVFFVFKKFKIRKRFFLSNNKIIFFYLSVLIIFLIWFLKHPTLRYGGYSIVFLTLSMPIALLYQFFENKNFFKKKLKYLILFLIIVFNTKNIERIGNELKRNDIYKFSDFPFFAIKEQKYFSTQFEDGLTIYETRGSHCWGTPTPCSNGMDPNIKVKEKNGYFFIYR